MYDLISNSPLKEAYLDGKLHILRSFCNEYLVLFIDIYLCVCVCVCVSIVMKLRRKVYFIEFAALLLQRTMEEGQPDLVLKWGQSMFEFLNRCAFTIYLSVVTKEYVKDFSFKFI